MSSERYNVILANVKAMMDSRDGLLWYRSGVDDAILEPYRFNPDTNQEAATDNLRTICQMMEGAYANMRSDDTPEHFYGTDMWTFCNRTIPFAVGRGVYSLYGAYIEQSYYGIIEYDAKRPPQYRYRGWIYFTPDTKYHGNIDDIIVCDPDQRGAFYKARKYPGVFRHRFVWDPSFDNWKPYALIGGILAYTMDPEDYKLYPSMLGMLCHRIEDWFESPADDVVKRKRQKIYAKEYHGTVYIAEWTGTKRNINFYAVPLATYLEHTGGKEPSHVEPTPKNQIKTHKFSDYTYVEESAFPLTDVVPTPLCVDIDL